MATLLSNTAASIAGYNLQDASNKLQASINRISGGSRIDKAGTDVAALAVGTQFRATVNILKSALQNASQATSMLGVADGGLQAESEILQRQATLASQASSGSLNDAARQYLNQEFQGLVEEIDRIATSTNFNDIGLIDGSLFEASSSVSSKTTADSSTASVTLQFGNNSSKNYTVSAGDITTVAGSKVVTVTLNNHGLTSTDTVSLMLAATIDTTVTAASVASKAVTVIDANTFTITGSIAATAGGTYGTGTDGVTLAGDLTKSYDLLDGNTLDINGVTFTAKNTTGTANNYTPSTAGQIATKTGQSATELATSIKASIDNYINTKASGYEKLMGVTISQDPTDQTKLVFTHSSRGVAGDTFYVKTGGGAAVSGGATKYYSDATFKASGGTLGALTMMNTNVYGIAQDPILNTLAGAQAKASFTIATNPDAAVDSGTPIAIGDITVNAAGNALKVVAPGHGYKGGEQLNFAGAITLGAGSGMTAALGNYTVRILDQDNFEIYGPSLSGTFTGVQAANTATAAYTHARAEERGDRLNVNGKEFKYVATLTGADNEILIGADIEATRKNTIAALNTSLDPRVNEATYAAGASAGVVTATYKANGVAADYQFTLGGNMRSTNLTITNSTLTGGTTSAGLDVSKITNNADFIGTIKGFKSVFQSTNKVNVQLDSGGHTYTANGINSNPSANSWVTFVSNDGGGSFKVQLAANQGQVVNNQADADNFSARLDKAFSSLSVTQRRQVTSFNGIGDIQNGAAKVGSLTNSSVYFNNDKFDNIKITDVQFTAPGSGQNDARIQMTIDGQTYTSSAGIGKVINKGSILRLSNLADANRYVEFVIGNTDLDLTSQGNADAIEKAYYNALDIGNTDSAGVEFQVGTKKTDKIEIQIEGARTRDIYKDEGNNTVVLDISTKEKASSALEIVKNAISKVNSIRAKVGVYQSRFGYVASAGNTSMQYQEEARSGFLDTDIGREASEMMMNQVRVQASIQMLATANQIPQQVLKLLQG